MGRFAVGAALAVVALALAGCSSSSDEKPAKTATVTKTPALSAAEQAEQRKACVDAWAKVFHGNADADPDAPPAECRGVPEADQLDVYMEGLEQRNQENQDELRKCLDDPSCTAWPVP